MLTADSCDIGVSRVIVANDESSRMRIVAVDRVESAAIAHCPAIVVDEIVFVDKVADGPSRIGISLDAHVADVVNIIVANDRALGVLLQADPATIIWRCWVADIVNRVVLDRRRPPKRHNAVTGKILNLKTVYRDRRARAEEEAKGGVINAAAVDDRSAGAVWGVVGEGFG